MVRYARPQRAPIAPRAEGAIEARTHEREYRLTL